MTGGMLQYPAPSRPVTNYLDIPIPSMQGADEYANGPSDAEIERAVHEMLDGADLNTVTKKNVRQRLEGMFGVDLSARKAVINAAIDHAITSQS